MSALMPDRTRGPRSPAEGVRGVAVAAAGEEEEEGGAVAEAAEVKLAPDAPWPRRAHTLITRSRSKPP